MQFTPNANLSEYGGKLFVCTYFSPYLFGIKQARLHNIRSDLPYKYLLQLPLSPGQTEPQVENLGLFATPFGQALRTLVLTCAHFGRDQICTQVEASFHRLATQPKSMQVE